MKNFIKIEISKNSINTDAPSLHLPTCDKFFPFTSKIHIYPEDFSVQFEFRILLDSELKKKGPDDKNHFA